MADAGARTQQRSQHCQYPAVQVKAKARRTDREGVTEDMGMEDGQCHVTYFEGFGAPRLS